MTALCIVAIYLAGGVAAAVFTASIFHELASGKREMIGHGIADALWAVVLGFVGIGAALWSLGSALVFAAAAYGFSLPEWGVINALREGMAPTFITTLSALGLILIGMAGGRK